MNNYFLNIQFQPKKIIADSAQVNLLKLAIILLTYIASMALIFRETIISGFDIGFGNRSDAVIEISILEHWRSALMGLASWNNPLYFHPYTDTLGYNDGYFLSGLFYATWRLGFDPFIADTMTALTFRTLGYVATLWLVRSVLGWRLSVAVIIATLAAISNNMFLQAGHAQINSLALLPIFAGLAILTIRAAIAHRPGAALLAMAAGALMGLWLITAFYFAWFTIYFTLVFVLCWLWTTGRMRPRAIWELLQEHWGTLTIFTTTSVLAAVPFLLVYVPKRLETGGHSFMVSYLVQPIDLVNVGERNLLWGWIAAGVRAIVTAISPPGGALERAFLGWEHHSGFPVLLFVLVSVAGYRLIRQREDLLVRSFALAVVISWALTLRIWQVSPWLLVYLLVPAASGVRAVLRYQLFLVLPLLLLAGLAYREPLARLWRHRPLLATGLVALLLLEQVNFGRPAELSRSEQLAAFDAVPHPPVGCRAFYVVTARTNEAPLTDSKMERSYPNNVDAMFLAERWRLPTINGFSTFNPPDWNFADRFAPDYDSRVSAYARRHGLTGLCGLDMRAKEPWKVK